MGYCFNEVWLFFNLFHLLYLFFFIKTYQYNNELIIIIINHFSRMNWFPNSFFFCANYTRLQCSLQGKNIENESRTKFNDNFVCRCCDGTKLLDTRVCKKNNVPLSTKKKLVNITSRNIWSAYMRGRSWQTRTYTPGSSNIVGWKMDPKIKMYFIISYWKWGQSVAMFVSGRVFQDIIKGSSRNCPTKNKQHTPTNM